MAGMPSGARQPILFRNASSTVFVVDIPTSIAAAQEVDGLPRRYLTSSEPLRRPFSTPEPKSEAALRKLEASNVGNGDLHEVYASLLTNAITEIQQHHAGDWCHPRNSVVSNKRKADEAGLDDCEGKGSQSDSQARRGDYPSLDHLLETLAAHEDSHFDPEGRNYPLVTYNMAPPLVDDTRPHEGSDDCATPAPRGLILPNISARTLIASVGEVGKLSEAQTFFLPPKSVSILADCNDSLPLRAALRAHVAPERRKFDLILLDPPWPNRSARRAARYSAARRSHDIRRLLRGMDLDAQLAPGGWVAVWVTNSGAARDAVLGRGGLFEALGDVTLVEEWVWAKVTAGGECMSALEGAWRRPYEVLLIGRHGLHLEYAGGEVVRRVVAAVPDLHSRKPCLKAMFGDLLFGGREYRALEVFARYAVAGWWSWGDQAVKFNWDGSWR